ncbi:MAG: hypothetical protein M1819_000367 [Sarea resinae]|nr:MAG: hypothetical protein M1819_000367 [Sarea resinae]
MSHGDIEERPTKKRRFFAEDSPTPESPQSPQSHQSPQSLSADDALDGEATSLDDINALPEAPLGEQSASNVNPADSLDSNAVEANLDGTSRDPLRAQPESSGGFDQTLFASFVGEEVAPETMDKIRDVSGDNMERAINLYFDGSWKTTAPAPPRTNSVVPGSLPGQSTLTFSRQNSRDSPAQSPNVSTPDRSIPRDKIPPWRYIGAFGVGAWATRSGTNLIQHGEAVKIERTKIQPPKPKPVKGGKAKGAVASSPRIVNKRGDIIVRFTNSRGEEVGRLPKETAAWVSTLIDQKVCRFEGTCVFVPDRLRTNDTVYLQLRCFLLRNAFEAGSFVKPLDNNRTTGLFEAKETEDEKDLRLRQVGLVKLFEEVNLLPSKTNETTEKHKRQGLLQAAEVAEQYNKEDQPRKGSENGASSPPASDDQEEGKELEQDQLDSLYQKAQSFDFDTPTAEPAETFAMDLREYQKQALYWMMGKEKDEQAENKRTSMHPLWEEYIWPVKDVDDKELPTVMGQEKFYVNPYSGELSLDFPVQEQNCLGGILADEMGLGKTIEMLSLVHSHQSDVALRATKQAASSVNGLPRLPKSSSSVEHAPCTTLVVAPMSLLAQWESEAENASKPGTLKTLVYYGSEKIANLQHLCCEANAASAPNVIITSYGVVLSEFNQVAANNGNRGSHGGIFSLNFFRVILDEAHHIKNRQSKTAKACYEISADHRWVLTGTPIVNRLEDLFSLVRFLKVEPWSNFSFWKTFITVPFESRDFIRALDVVQTVLEPLVLRRTKDMKTPDGKALVPLPPRNIEIVEIELSKQEREVYDHIFTRAKRTFAANVEAGTVMKSYTTIFAQILRLRQSCCHPLLTRNKTIVAEEEEAAAAAKELNGGLADDMDLEELIARFEAADEDDADANKFPAHVLKQIQDEADNECPICAEEPMIEQTVTGCWHSACKKCLLGYIEHQQKKHPDAPPRCFNCREPISPRDVFEVVRHDHLSPSSLSPTQHPPMSLRRISTHNTSAKIAALLTHLKRLRRDHPEEKAVVFSQFTSFLDLLEPALKRDHIGFLRLDGSMAQKARKDVLSAFAERPSPRNPQPDALSAQTQEQESVSLSPPPPAKPKPPPPQSKPHVLLLSLRAGGVGLNLTSASHVFMLDPWWSFAVESQAIDRVHRMGQSRPVHVYRFIVATSVEERMLKVQMRKQAIAGALGMMGEGAGGKEGEEERRKRRIEDIGVLLS